MALQTGKDWAISDGNAGAFHTSFYRDLKELKNLDWKSIRATSWQGMTHQKSAEFLVADFFPWPAFHAIGCHNREVAAKSPLSLTRRPIVLLYPSNPLGIIKEP